MLAWIFSRNFNGFKDQKASQLQLIEEVFGIRVADIDQTLAESEKIDLQIDCPEVLLIIENKLKTSQHSNQLARYKEAIEKKYTNKATLFFFLTLCDESSLNNDWKNISYLSLLFAFDKIKNTGGICDNFHGWILLDYMETIRKFTNIVSTFIKNTGSFDRVFLEGKSTKKAKLEKGMNESLDEKFIRENQLETILQMHYFQKVRSYLKIPKNIM